MKPASARAWSTAAAATRSKQSPSDAVPARQRSLRAMRRPPAAALRPTRTRGKQHGARAEREGGSTAASPWGVTPKSGRRLRPGRRRLRRRRHLERGGLVLVRLHAAPAVRLVQGARAVDVVLHRVEEAPSQASSVSVPLVWSSSSRSSSSSRRTAPRRPYCDRSPSAGTGARLLVLRDRLERFDVLKPEPDHTGATSRGADRVTGCRAARGPRRAPRAGPRRRTGSQAGSADLRLEDR